MADENKNLENENVTPAGAIPAGYYENDDGQITMDPAAWTASAREDTVAEATPEDIPLREGKGGQLAFDLHSIGRGYVKGASEALTPEEAAAQEKEREAMAADMESYQRAFNEYSGVYMDAPVQNDPAPGDSHRTLDPNKREYVGEAGTFQYDPKEFALKQMQANMPDGSMKSIETLVYIGQETDGSKIHIPDGVRNMAGMFANSKLKSAPQIPMGVQNMDMAFMGCENLKSAKITIPPTVRDMNLTFAGCKNMTKGPVVIPGTVKNADYAFAQCASLKTTPRLGHGMESISGIFADCRNLTKTPTIPQTVRRADYATSNCPGMDGARDAKAQERLEKARAKQYEKLTRPTLGAKLGQSISYLMQAHALRKMGYGAVMAPIIAHSMRKNGVIAKDFRSGFGMMMMNRNPMMGRMMMMNAKDRVEKSEKQRQATIDRKMAAWDRAHDSYSYGLIETKNIFAKAGLNGEKDAKNNMFLRMANMDGSQLNIYRETHGRSAAYDQQERVLNAASQNGVGLDAQARHQYATWYKQQMAQYMQYFRDADAQIDQMNYSKAQRADAKEGLGLMKDIGLSPIVASMRRMQQDHQLFNDGDMRDIDRMMKSIGVEPVFQGHIERQGQSQIHVNFRDIGSKESQADNSQPTHDDAHSQQQSTQQLDHQQPAQQPKHLQQPVPEPKPQQSAQQPQATASSSASNTITVLKENARIWTPKDDSPKLVVSIPHEKSPNGVGTVYIPLYQMHTNENGSYDVNVKNSDYAVHYKGAPKEGDHITASEFSSRVSSGVMPTTGKPTRQEQAEAVSAGVTKDQPQGPEMSK